MKKLWRGTDIEAQVPELGLSLPFALLTPEFVVQFLATDFVRQDAAFNLSPLDDVRAWLRTEGEAQGGHVEELAELLLSEEREARKVVAKAGGAFDLLDFEFLQMEREDFENFPPPLVRRILEIVLEESDQIRPMVEKETLSPFSLSLSFSLPLPHRHHAMKEAEIAGHLAQYGAQPEVLRRVEQKKMAPAELEAVLLFDLVGRGQAVPLQRTAESGVVRVPLGDPRTGDLTDLQLSLVYPVATEGYFLASFEAITRALSLKGPA